MSDLTDESHPEGPYDRLSQTPRSKLSNTELSRFIDFIEKLEEETEHSLSLSHGYREMRMMLHLMRNHLAGRLTTPTSLADASGLSYGTAKRGIESIIARGLILSRPRTKSGKTVSLHPSPMMIDEWETYAHRIKGLLGPLFGVDPVSETGRRIFLDAAATDHVISPPAVLSARLELKGGLRGLIHADPTFMAMHNLKQQLESIFGLEIHNSARSIDDLLKAILANAGRATSRYDLVACDLPWFGELASKGILQPLDRFMRRDAYDLSDFHPVAVQSTRYAGQQYGIPLQTTPELLCYRKDIFEQAQLEPPTTTEELVKVARRLHDPARGRYGIAWNAARGTPLGHTFSFLMAKFGQPIINLRRRQGGYDFQQAVGEELRPMFQSDAAYRACEYMLDILKYSPPHILNMAWYERAQSYASGEACMAYNYTLLAPLFELNKDSPAWGNTGYLPHPVGNHGRPITPIGGYALAIPANLAEERVESVWTALRHLTSANMSKLYILNGSLVTPRFSVSQDPEVSALSPLIEVVDDMARKDILQAWPRPPVPGITDVISIAGNEIFEVLDGRRSIKKALSMAQDRADRVMRDRGYY
ncbi:multiple sugar transport system substrate-binding protein [Halomonas fontilapidosi]|uniref:Multiple sugar transport system substrate-binding protein n=1 Tax=Halomonas fontilapidosi TaxID=616675 RepID=A0A7W5H054_9GAMM|nr:extracellular solute-binding protein [Halomonas fontilapidosi]MBB3184926.1 multiple sugar transport system substrate-binding protein [Halomonas fontilapidosi]